MQVSGLPVLIINPVRRRTSPSLNRLPWNGIEANTPPKPSIERAPTPHEAHPAAKNPGIAPRESRLTLFLLNCTAVLVMVTPISIENNVVSIMPTAPEVAYMPERRVMNAIYQ